jgi:hypothetical protein
VECATVVRGKLCTILKCCLWVYYVVRLCMLGGMDRWVSGGGGLGLNRRSTWGWCKPEVRNAGPHDFHAGGQ